VREGAPLREIYKTLYREEIEGFGGAGEIRRPPENAMRETRSGLKRV
jgi:hypothetical protein